MMSHIKILILNWNGADLIEKCLDSVMKINYNNFSVVVIDNKSSDNSINIIQNNFPQVDIISLDKNYGFAGGYNRGFKQLENDEVEYVLLLNNDTVVDSEILTHFNIAKNKYGENNIYGAKIFYHKYPQIIWYAGGIINFLFFNIAHRGIRQKDSIKFTEPILTDYVTGCCLFTSFQIIKQLGGFDEQFNMYAEDVDFCLRAKQNGINNYFYPNAKLWHHVSASIGGEFSWRKIYRKLISRIKLLFKYVF